MEPELVRMPRVPRPTSIVVFVLVFVGIVLFIGGGPIRTVPAGNVGVKDFFSQVSASTLSPGVNVVVPSNSWRRAVASSRLAEPARQYGGAHESVDGFGSRRQSSLGRD
jgi:hypothetical protein